METMPPYYEASAAELWHEVLLDSQNSIDINSQNTYSTGIRSLLNFATDCDNQPAGGAQPQIGTSDPLENSGFLNLGGDDPSEICLLSDRCPGDVNFDDVVDVNDVLGLIQVWGTNDFGGDLDGSGLVDVNDILRLIEFYGQPCPE